MSLVYMKYGTKIKGEVTSEGHEGWIECTSFQFGTGRGIGNPTGTAATRETGSVNVSEIVITKINDVASEPLFRESLDGKAADCIIEFTKSNDAGGFECYIQLTLGECLVSSFSMSSGGEKPVESLSLSFTKITYKYIPYDSAHKPLSPLTGGYDLKATKAF
jgi:type VI secretion system secreted protein Hcp